MFKKLDPVSWKASSENWVRMLCMIPHEKLEEAAKDKAFLEQMDRLYVRFKNYMESTTWYERKFGSKEQAYVAYFSCEYGMHHSLPIYSGGLGILSGDHLKSASDLGIPLVAVGMLYRQGYFKQRINAEGWQQEIFPENDWYSLPVKLVKKEDGHRLLLSINIGEELVHFQVWSVAVGRIFLYLLDTNLEINTPENRDITMRLYDTHGDVRIKQEVLLGIGGVRALKAIGINPSVYHSNEGHSAFLMIERIRNLMKEYDLSFKEARELTWACNVFTTHTPVPAGNERFDVEKIENYLAKYVSEIGMSMDEFIGLGRENPADSEEKFCMTVLALKLASHANGVAKLHGVISREMWQKLFSEIPMDEIPIGHITNGIHTRSWLSPQLSSLILRYLGPETLDEPSELGTFKDIDKIPDAELWKVHEERRKILVYFCRKRVQSRIRRIGGTADQVSKAQEILVPNILTIGFARRFATYKRANLLLKDPERLKRLILNPERPVQFVFSGKAHPADHQGKELIKEIYNFAIQNGLSHRIVFLEDYDYAVARHLVQGVDVWLNNPRRPLEASGTSGMKAAVNGSLNLSVMDGWWDEAYTPEVGWSIGNGEEYADTKYQDDIEGSLLYRVLEQDIIPTFYNRNEQGIPEQWVYMMKQSIGKLGSYFNTHRMVMDYTNKFYIKADELFHVLMESGASAAKELAAWRDKVNREWDDIQILKVESNVTEVMYVGNELQVTAQVNLGKFKPENIIVEVYHGSLSAQNNIEKGYRVRMEPESGEGSIVNFKGSIPCQTGGRYGFSVRLLPGHKNLAVQFLPGLIKWAAL